MVMRISVLVFVNLIRSGIWNPVHPVSQFRFVLLPILAVIVFNSLIRSETWTPCITVSLLPRDKVKPWLVVSVIVEYLVVLLAYDHVVLRARSLPLVHHDRQDGHHLVQGAEVEESRVRKLFKNVVFL